MPMYSFLVKNDVSSSWLIFMKLVVSVVVGLRPSFKRDSYISLGTSLGGKWTDIDKI